MARARPFNEKEVMVMGYRYFFRANWRLRLLGFRRACPGLRSGVRRN